MEGRRPPGEAGVRRLRAGGDSGVYANGTVYPPELYQEAAAPLDEGELPLLNLVWVGLYRTEEGMGAYTDGLRSFGKDELEVLDARPSPPRCGISS